jgi:hypothetical protein
MVGGGGRRVAGNGVDDDDNRRAPPSQVYFIIDVHVVHIIHDPRNVHRTARDTRGVHIRIHAREHTLREPGILPERIWTLPPGERNTRLANVPLRVLDIPQSTFHVS